MANIKLNINYEQHKELEEAARFYGISLNELYYRMIDDFIGECHEKQTNSSKKPVIRRQMKIRRMMASAYKQVERQKEKGRKIKPAEVFEIS